MGRTLLFVLATAFVAQAQPAADDASFRSYQAHVAAAEKSLRLEQAAELHRWLANAPVEHRGWEWSYLDGVRDRSLRMVTAEEPPIRLAMAANGARVLTVEGTHVRLRRWPSLAVERTLTHEDAVYRAVFSPDGKRVASVARDVTARVWDVETGREVARITLANPAFAAVTFHPEGHEFATCAWERVDGQVYGVVWIAEAVTGAVRVRERVGIKPLSSLEYSRDGSRLVVGSWDGLVHILDRDAKEVSLLHVPDDRGAYNAVNDIALDPRGARVAVASKDRTVRVFECESGQLVATLLGHGGYVEGLQYANDGTTLATCSGDATVRLWDTLTWACRGVLRGHVATVRGVAFSPDSERVITASLDGAVGVFAADALHGAWRTISVPAEGTYTTTFHPRGESVAVACYDGWLRTYSRTGKTGPAWHAHPGSTCHGASFSADGTRLATCSWDETVRVFAYPEGRELFVLRAGQGVHATALSPDGSRAVLAAGTLQLWNVDAQERLSEHARDGASPRCVAFDLDATTIAVGWSDGVVRLYRARDFELVREWGGHGGGVTAVTCTADGVVLTGDARGHVRAFDGASGGMRFDTRLGDRTIQHLAVRGARIAVATDRLCILDLERGALLLECEPHSDAPYHVSWSTRGELASCAVQGTVAILEGR